MTSLDLRGVSATGKPIRPSDAAYGFDGADASADAARRSTWQQALEMSGLYVQYSTDGSTPSDSSSPNDSHFRIASGTEKPGNGSNRWSAWIPLGGASVPMAPDDMYFGTSTDATPQGAELAIEAQNGMGIIPAYAGDMHHLIARLATENDIISVMYSDDQSQTNQIGAFTKFASTVVPTSAIQPFNVWVSEQALSQPAPVTITVR